MRIRDTTYRDPEAPNSFFSTEEGRTVLSVDMTCKGGKFKLCHTHTHTPVTFGRAFSDQFFDCFVTSSALWVSEDLVMILIHLCPTNVLATAKLRCKCIKVRP